MNRSGKTVKLMTPLAEALLPRMPHSNAIDMVLAERMP